MQRVGKRVDCLDYPKAAWLAALKAVQRVEMTVDRKVDQSVDNLVESSVAMLADQ